MNKIEMARPYAKAAFDYALEHKQQDLWLKNLRNLTKAVQNPLLQSAIDNPKFTPQQLVDICIAVTVDWNQAGYNFIRLIAENYRLAFLPEIAELFSALCKEHENIIDVNVHSAIPLDENYRERLLKALQKKLKRKVMLHFKEETSLIGGVILRINDWVLDASIKGQFEKMRSALVE